MTLKSKIDDLNGPAARAFIDKEWSDREKLAFNIGFGRAKNSCAQLAISADVQIEQLRAILTRIIASADEPGSRNGVDENYVIVHARLITEAREVLK
jgi:hypothetical protein